MAKRNIWLCQWCGAINHKSQWKKLGMGWLCPICKVAGDIHPTTHDAMTTQEREEAQEHFAKFGSLDEFFK